MIDLHPGLCAATLLGMLTLVMLASALVARKTVRRPVVEALAHV